ncbi:Flp family type IVb pilin [bacterium]|nr:MAG: Flp family type IVb pilin [bacterium]
MINSFWIEEDGQTLIEYGLLISLIALVVVGAVATLGAQVRNMWGGNANKYPDSQPN